MKTWTKTVYERHYSSPSKWGQRIESYIKIQRHFDFREGLRYSVSVPNKSVCRRTIKQALIDMMEKESIGMGKYEGLKEQMYKHRLWNLVG